MKPTAKMKNNHHQYFELLCSFLAQEHIDSESKLYTEGEIKRIDWGGVFQIADGYLVIPALYLSLKRKGYLTYLDSEPRNFLEAIYELNCEHNSQLKDEALNVIRLLNYQGIKPVLLKGIAGLLTGLYEDDGERVIGDIDLLIDQTELVKAVALLVEYGYWCDREDLYQQICKGDFHIQEIAIFTRSGQSVIDLHVRPIGSSGDKAFLSVEDAIGNAKLIEVDGVFAFLPDLFFRLTHNFYHAHHMDCYSFLYGEINLRQLIDWSEILKRYRARSSLEELSNRARLHGKLTSYRLYKMNAWEFLGTPKTENSRDGLLEKVLFLRQKLIIQNSMLYHINRALAYIISGALIFSPERLRMRFGDIPFWNLIILRIKRFFVFEWYSLRLKEIIGLCRGR